MPSLPRIRRTRPPGTGDVLARPEPRVAEITGLPEDIVTRSRGFIRDAYVKHLRSGDASFAPDAVVLPADAQQVRAEPERVAALDLHGLPVSDDQAVRHADARRQPGRNGKERFSQAGWAVRPEATTPAQLPPA